MQTLAKVQPVAHKDPEEGGLWMRIQREPTFFPMRMSVQLLKWVLLVSLNKKELPAIYEAHP